MPKSKESFFNPGGSGSVGDGGTSAIEGEGGSVVTKYLIPRKQVY